MKYAMTRRTALQTAVGAMLAAALGCMGLAGCSAPAEQQKSEPAPVQQQEPQTRTVTDMAGRSVELPIDVKSVATFGSVGVLNAFVECMGKGDLIANEMPANSTKSDKWAMQYQFAPQIKNG
ncbi:MAG: hypothetical protein RSD15_11550, partial [Gordonibacter sp.]